MPKPKVYTTGFRYFACNECNQDILPGQQYLLKGKKKYHLRPNCAHAVSVTVTEPIPLLDESKWRRLGGRHVRLLRSYSRIAEKDYYCWRCEHSKSVNQQSMSVIFEGSQYDAEVWVTKTGFEVRRYHDLCPWEPEYDDWLSEDEDDDLVEETEWSLPLAA